MRVRMGGGGGGRRRWRRGAHGVEAISGGLPPRPSIHIPSSTPATMYRSSCDIFWSRSRVRMDDTLPQSSGRMRLGCS